jgi:metal-responsive CopG/Arc/MetJ family transcriptional regulator
MRILVDLATAQAAELNALSRKEKRARAALIREAIDQYLARLRPEPDESAFGLWGDRRLDGLEFERKVRSEW